jgi:hypothetical protein
VVHEVEVHVGEVGADLVFVGGHAGDPPSDLLLDRVSQRGR